MDQYKHPEVLVFTEWIAEHLSDPKLRRVEIEVDTTACDQGHIPRAVDVPWAQTANEDSTFKSADLLKQLYEGQRKELGRLLGRMEKSRCCTYRQYLGGGWRQLTMTADSWSEQD